MEDILPSYLAIGVDYERFMDSCPHELKPFESAHIKRLKMRDREMFEMGRYVYESVLCAVDNALRGKDSKLTYRTKSFWEEAEQEKEQGEELSKAEKKRQEMLLYNGLNAMKLRFEVARAQREVMHDGGWRH